MKTLLLCSLLALPLFGSGAVIITESFGGGSSGWIDRDPLEMVVVPSPTGNPTYGLQGTFALQGAPGIETDAFRATAASSGGAFVGDYTSLPDFTGWRFHVYAENVLPSDLLFRFSDGLNTFTYSATAELASLNRWTTIFAQADFEAGDWLGAGEAAFDTALSNVQWIEIQVTRNGQSEQTYRVDNVETLDYLPQPMPEPGTFTLVLLAGALVARVRRGPGGLDAATSA